MPRWEPDARGRLVRAAIDLFAEQGYEATTTALIAQRAGLTKTTFFRHFPDKREVLFIGQDILIGLATSAIADATDAGPLDLVAAGVAAMAGAHTAEQREYAPRLQAVIREHPELLERAAFKRASITAAMSGALVARGVGAVPAGLAAELGARAYYLGFDRWVSAGDARSAGAFALAALEELRAAISALA